MADDRWVSETGPQGLPVSVRWDCPPVSGQLLREGDFVLPVGTVTLLLADVEGSTRLWEDDADAMKAAMCRLDRVVDDAIGCHGGVRPIEQGEGDSFVAAFARASDAVAAALALQLDDFGPITLRLGLHTGEVQLRDEGNYIGSAINRCARVRDLAHGGQTVLSQPVHDLVVDQLPEGTWLVDLGTHRLRDLSRSERVYQLAHPDLRVEFPALRSLDAYRNNLPAQMTSFVGRTGELATVVDLLTEARLVTLTGSGGCGKTRLALQAAAEVVTDHRDGVWYVDLSTCADPELVPVIVAKTLRLQDVPTRSTMDTLVGYLADRQVLLLVDNCEHLISSSAETIETLLQHCPSLTVLATSREPLSINGEAAWRVPSLTLPGDAAPAPIQAVSDSEAVALFVERAVRARPGFELTAANSDAVAMICRRLDGIPLAIELAAARVRAFTPEQILDRLHDRFRLLTGGARTAVPRQHTLRASVDWSHQLLTEPERVLFRRLAVFGGSFDLAAAEGVAAGDPLESHQVLDQLSLLVDKSLVATLDAGGEFRYRLLETVRHYAQERLSESGEADAVRQQHRTWYVEFAEQAWIAAMSGDTNLWVDRQLAELDNIRVAFSSSRETNSHVDALRLAVAMSPVWIWRGHENEGRQWLKVALEHQHEASPRMRAIALFTSGMLASQMLAPTGIEQCDQGVAVAREIGDPNLLAWSLILSSGAYLQPNPQRARTLAEEGLELARQGTPQLVPFALASLANACRSCGELLRARELLEECQRISTPESPASTNGSFALAETLYWLGEIRAARDLAHTCVVQAERAGNRFLLVMALYTEARATARLGQGEDAVDIACRSLALAHEFGHLGCQAHAHDALGHAHLASGDARSAVESYRRARELFEVTGRVAALLFAQLAEAELAAGDRESAARHARQACAEAAMTRADGKPRPFPVEARIALLDGNATEAEDLAHRALAGRGQAIPFVPDTLELLAALSAHHDSNVEATRLFAAADALRERTGVARSLIYRDWYETAMATLRDALTNEDYERAWSEGAALSIDDAIAYATRGRGERKRPATGWASLTPTELEVVRLVGEGMTNQEIAQQLFISPRTVQAHLTHIYAKLEITSRVRLAQAAHRGEMTSPSP